MLKGQDFEKEFKKYLNNHFSNVICTRQLQTRFCNQGWDLILEFKNKKSIYIECKNITQNFYFKTYFHKKQINTLNKSLKFNLGVLAIRKNNNIFIFSWWWVLYLFLTEQKIDKIYFFKFKITSRAGFEPTQKIFSCFQDNPHSPLGHLNISY